MKININFKYHQEYLPTKRHRNARTRNVLENMNVNIKELSAEEFPIAFIIHDMKSVCDGMTSFEDYCNKKSNFRMLDEEIRTYKGKLYSPIRITHGAAISTLFENAEDIKRTIEMDVYISDYGSNNREFTEKSVILKDDKKEIIKQVRNEGKRYLYFDGKFWSRCGEPRYNITTFGLGHNHGGTGFFIEYEYNPNISSKNYFNALQREEAISYGKSVALNRGDTKSVDGMGDYDIIEVIKPELVKCKPNKEHGNGCAFMNDMEEVINKSDNATESGIMCMALAIAGLQ